MLFPLGGLTKSSVLYLGDPDGSTTYTSTDNIIISVSGADTTPPNPNVRVSLGAALVSIGLPGVPLILGTDTILGGIGNAVPVYIQVTLVAGAESEFTGVQLEASALSEGGSQVSWVSANLDVVRW